MSFEQSRWISKALKVLACPSAYFGFAFLICLNAALGSTRHVIAPDGVSKIHTTNQNWTDDEASGFYNIPQGSKLVPYRWFLVLEKADSGELFRGAENFRRLGYLPRGAAVPGNPDGLPIGFVKDGDHLGMTCAACHTNQIHFKGEAWLIDGAPTLGDFAVLQRELVAALEATAEDDAKFGRFSANILGTAATPEASENLRTELRNVVAFRKGYNTRNLPKGGTPEFGPGRVDAFGAIMNEVTVTFAEVPDNHRPANAPVSYPFLWDTPHHDKVQWNGSAPNTTIPIAVPPLNTKHIGALGRNTGEVLGVFGTVKADGGFLGLGGYSSSVNKPNLIEIEEMLRKLWSPQWPVQFGSINPDDQLRGKQLFYAHCAECHSSEPGKPSDFDRTSPNRRIEASMADVGTDPLMASNFAMRRARTGVLKGRVIEYQKFGLFGLEAGVPEMLSHMVQRVVVGPEDPGNSNASALAEIPRYSVNAELALDNDRKLVGSFEQIKIENGRVKELTSEERLKINELGRILVQDESAFDEPGRFLSRNGLQKKFNLAKRPLTNFATSGEATRVRFDEPVPVALLYKGRPLNGIWATAPYLHNGSVPNLDELLKPSDERIKKFRLGSREFDPVKVGFVTEGEFEFDTSLPGNSNAGHTYNRVFSDEERRLLIEYMKTL